VRVHTAAASQASAAALGARAYTLGRDLHFAPGQYRPGTGAGDRPHATSTANTPRCTMP